MWKFLTYLFRKSSGKILSKTIDKVQKGEEVIVIENEVVSEFTGVVKQVAVSKGDSVQNGQLLIVIG